MGLLDSLEQMTTGGNKSQVAGSVMSALDEHPGGLGGLLQSFQQNGMGQHVQNWQNGQATPMTPDQVQQGTGNTGFIENVAARAGISPEMAKIGMAVVLPMIVSHLSQTGQNPQQGEFGGLASSVLSRIL